MGTYNLPRNVKGEGRILFIFTAKSLIYTVVAAAIGLLFYFIFSALKMTMVGIAIVAIFALIGFGIGTLKMPELGKFEFAKKTGRRKFGRYLKKSNKIQNKRQKSICVQGGRKQ